MEEKAKKKAGGSAKKPPQPAKRADGKVCAVLSEGELVFSEYGLPSFF